MEISKEYLREALTRATKSEICRELRISRPTLNRLLLESGFKIPETRGRPRIRLGD